jgi:hypothetical protein
MLSMQDDTRRTVEPRFRYRLPATLIGDGCALSLI